MKPTAHLRRRSAHERQSTSPVALPRHRREYGAPGSFTATEVKNEFGRMLEKAIQGQVVVITKHDTPKAVLISVEHFNALKDAPEVKLDTLSSEFDALLVRMQGPKARTAMKAAFGASPRQLGKAAVLVARKNG